jgi:hypothetical protein
MGYVARGSMPNNYYFTVTPNKTQAIPIDFVDPRNLTLTFNINLVNGFHIVPAYSSKIKYSLMEARTLASVLLSDPPPPATTFFAVPRTTRC